MRHREKRVGARHTEFETRFPSNGRSEKKPSGAIRALPLENLSEGEGWDKRFGKRTWQGSLKNLDTLGAFVGANEVVDEITFAPKRCARKLRLGNPYSRSGGHMAWATHARNPTMARPLGLALCRTRLLTGAGKIQVRTSSGRVERGAEGKITNAT